MGLSSEWEQLFGSGAAMTLSSATAPGPAGGGNPDLKASQGPWTGASAVASDLTGSTNAAVTRLDTSHDGVVPTLEGFMLPAVLGEVRTSWKGRLEDVRAECARLEGTLRTAGKEFGEIDVKIKQSFAGLRPGSR
ncbi:hypothetical protein [Streptomyces sp. G-G2]|uniref:hypothetical protein n=1 Tax=Streptomyces sp. G-G2 TaxID=3046201 RepID=UPI0024B8E830|nr:hypothetical protein [Streptomyces sp. G-G2]MDJ0384156.1 hypothetical protein [Streptomyces sp. G-G2]